MVQANGSLFSKFYPRIILWPFGYFHYFESLLTAHPYLLSLVGLKAGNFALTDEWTTQRVEVLEYTLLFAQAGICTLKHISMVTIM